MNCIVAAVAACLGVTWVGGASANDSAATVGAGGLQFEKTNEVRMLRENLFLSLHEVRVAYVFRNLTDHDVRLQVALPMPDKTDERDSA
jgi:Domain of unknown function (DUF4424)